MSPIMITSSLLTLFSVTSLVTQTTSAGYVGDRLMQEVMANTSRHLRPVRDHSRNTTVFFRLMLYQILGADSVQGKIHLHFWAEMFWKNEFVRYVFLFFQKKNGVLNSEY